MFEYLRYYFTEENFNNINTFLENEDNNHKFLNISINKKNENINDFLINCLKEKYNDDLIILNEEELNEFEYVDHNTGMPDLFGDDDIDEVLNNDNFTRNKQIWERYINIFFTKKIVIIPQILKTTLFKFILAKEFFAFNSLINNEMIRGNFKSNIVVINKLTDENMNNLDLGIQRRMLRTNIDYRINENTNIFKLELIEKTCMTFT